MSFLLQCFIYVAIRVSMLSSHDDWIYSILIERAI